MLILLISLLEFNLQDQKQAAYKMFGPDTDYSLIDEGKQYCKTVFTTS
jgi:hypothetical protein